MVIFKNLLHAVLSLIICLLGVAVLFLFAGAEFLAVSQIMIYAGGILILVVFGLMLTSKIGTETSNGNNSNFIKVVILMLAFFSFFAFKIMGLEIEGTKQYDKNAIKKIGFRLLSEHLFAFEAITILLLISLLTGQQ